MGPEDEYPRYEDVIRHFENHLETFKAFVKEIGLGPLKPYQYEISYFNQITQNEGWSSFKDLGSVFPDFGWRADKDRFLPEPENINWRTGFLLPNKAGRLHMALRNATRKTDGRQILFLELTARGFLHDSATDSMRTWFDLGREWIVRGFTDLTGEQIQNVVWGRKR